jgi:hypothetical protein
MTLYSGNCKRHFVKLLHQRICLLLPGRRFLQCSLTTSSRCSSSARMENFRESGNRLTRHSIFSDLLILYHHPTRNFLFLAYRLHSLRRPVVGAGVLALQVLRLRRGARVRSISIRSLKNFNNFVIAEYSGRHPANLAGSRLGRSLVQSELR